jgi:hypothetical protein
MDHAKYKIRGLTVTNRNIICFLCIVALLLSGCQPLRKKFTRKKKKEREESEKFIPILEPIDYPPRVYTLEQDYKKHYSLWKIWDTDLVQSIENNDSDKRQKYLLSKALGELEEMEALLGEGKQAGFGTILEQLREVQKEYEKPAVMRNKITIKKQLALRAKEIRNQYSPKHVFPNQQ